MITLLKEYVFLAPYATAFGVVIAIYQVWRNIEQSKTAFEDSLSKEYREIIRSIPYSALIGEQITEDDQEHEFNKVYNYMDFCNEQIFLRKNGRVRENTWIDWQNGMKINFSLPIFEETSKKVFDKLPDIFHELRMVKDKNFDTDPNKW